MAKFNRGGIKGHNLRELSKKEEQERKRRKREEKRKCKQRTQPETPLVDIHDRYPLNILFYGSMGWYNLLLGKLRLADNISYSDFADIPNVIDSLDVIIVDCARGSDGFLAKPFLELISEEDITAKICLSYRDGTDIGDLMKYQDAMFPYSRTIAIRGYLDSIRESKRG